MPINFYDAYLSDDMINSIKNDLMGPIAIIGDTITQGLVKTILLAIGLDMAAYRVLVHRTQLSFL